MSLNGDWDFTWVSGKSGEAPRKAKIAVPGCWQLQGDFDPPLYTNSKYPFAIRPPVASGETPEHPDWTINRFPDPVGVYEREFVLPARWEGRRIVVHFGGVSSANVEAAIDVLAGNREAKGVMTYDVKFQ